MIDHIVGRLVEKNPTDVVIQAGGVGYFINISLHTFSKINDHKQLHLYTHLQVREDAHTLYGFAEKAERDVFRLLISVSGIGANTARTMLSSMAPLQVRDAIACGDAKAIQSIKGIGVKTAQRVILDLKDKVLKIYDLDQQDAFATDNTNANEALSALEVLGYTKKQAEKVLDKITKQHPGASIEVLIKQALQLL